MGKVEIIRPDDVIEALVTGSEVLHISSDVLDDHRYGVSCERMGMRSFNNIKDTVENAGDDDIFLKITPEVEKDEKPEEPPVEDEM